MFDAWLRSWSLLVFFDLLGLVRLAVYSIAALTRPAMPISAFTVNFDDVIFESSPLRSMSPLASMTAKTELAGA